MNLEARRMVPLAHVKASVMVSGWLPSWSAKKERQLARRKARGEQAEYERMKRQQPSPQEVVTLPRQFWHRIADRVRRFFSRRAT